MAPAAVRRDVSWGGEGGEGRAGGASGGERGERAGMGGKRRGKRDAPGKQERRGWHTARQQRLIQYAMRTDEERGGKRADLGQKKREERGLPQARRDV